MAKLLLSTEEQKYLADSDYLKKDLKRMTAEKNKLEVEINSTTKKVSDLKGEQIALERKAKELKSKAEEDAKVIRNNAKEIEKKANEKRSDIERKLSEIADEKRELNNFIKSNEGREKNLIFAQSEVDKLKSRLITIQGMIKKEMG